MYLPTATATAGVQPVGLDSADTSPECSTATNLKGKRRREEDKERKVAVRSGARVDAGFVYWL